jgi:hypothetical protein
VIFSLLLLIFDFSKIDVVMVVVTGPTGWLTYKRRTSMFVSFFELQPNSYVMVWWMRGSMLLIADTIDALSTNAGFAFRWMR